MPLISVIMPAYNAGLHIREALGSVLAQTFTDFEVIAVDDGSKDDTAAQIAEAAASDNRVRLVRQPNGGVSCARNLALSAASGSVFALLDGDDVWDSQFLEEQFRILRARTDVDIVTGNAFEMGGHRDGQPARPFPDTRPNPDLAAILADEAAVFIMTLFRRAVYERIGGFDESLRTNEDYDYWLRAAAAGFVFARNDRPLGGYRRSNQSLSANDVRMLRGILYVFQKLRPSLLNRLDELALLDRQVDRFETELLAAEARAAIEAGDHATAAARLSELRRRRPGTALSVAEALARWAPGLLPMLYRARRARLTKRAACATP